MYITSMTLLNMKLLLNTTISKLMFLLQCNRFRKMTYSALKNYQFFCKLMLDYLRNDIIVLYDFFILTSQESCIKEEVIANQIKPLNILFL